MRFILMNGRTPCRQSVCALCCKPIGASYLREIETRLSYCDHDCYAQHCEGAVLALEIMREQHTQPSPHRGTEGSTSSAGKVVRAPAVERNPGATCEPRVLNRALFQTDRSGVCVRVTRKGSAADNVSAATSSLLAA